MATKGKEWRGKNREKERENGGGGRADRRMIQGAPPFQTFRGESQMENGGGILIKTKKKRGVKKESYTGERSAPVHREPLPVTLKTIREGQGKLWEKG